MFKSTARTSLATTRAAWRALEIGFEQRECETNNAHGNKRNAGKTTKETPEQRRKAALSNESGNGIKNASVRNTISGAYLHDYGFTDSLMNQIARGLVMTMKTSNREDRYA
jgi:hypothetical protein